MSEILQNTDMALIIKIVHELQNPIALASAKAHPVKFFAEHGINLPVNMEYEIHLNNDEFFYIIVPPAFDSILSDEMLNVVAAGFTSQACVATLFLSASSVGTASCPFGSAGCILSSLSTASTLSSVSPTKACSDFSYKDKKN